MRARRPGPGAMTATERDGRAIMDALRQSARLTETSLGISAAQLFVLHQLADEAGLSINALAERTLTDQSSVSLVVGRLAERGLVARRSAPEDRRRTTVART